jgi:hypothetical protein
VALFTPARWAYPPLTTEFKEGKEGDELQLRTVAKNDASAILNTAELNTIALVLHLLGAPRVENPYRVVFFDDPLQNMDELTVTTIARGLARLIRASHEHASLRTWDIVLLLHGADDCDRIAREAPASLYAFPWVTPSKRSLGTKHDPNSRSDADDIEARPGTEGGDLQPLVGLFTAS